VSIICRNCGQENPAGFRICGMCGTSLAPVESQRQERKVVTVLFCDLVGFTTAAERLDPEDVRAILAPYHERLRYELERHGGTVEKFIGDAVMALFGAPVAHEDDPERAIRAGLAIRDFAVETDLELRIGITTGEALIAIGASPADGEGMASGDVVNTAARLQAAAPVNGILADETTYRITRDVVDFRPAPDVTAKGKAEPIPTWEARDARSRFGVDVTHHARTRLVGRERELSLLVDALDRARYERIPQLITLVGVPGIGKTRLVHELYLTVDADADLITWRQGRCLAYGDGAAFWAVAEIVKAQAGIGEQDGPEPAAAKLRDAVQLVVETAAEARWVETHLRPLVGLGIDAGSGEDRRGEAFAAWRRFLEALAEARPLVLVIEDLHWADDGLLDFVDELVGWLADVPLLVIATARPELLERRPGWGGGKLNASTLALTPLSSDQTAVLLADVLGSPELPSGVQQTLLERADGNPLYAEQFAQLYLERGSDADLLMPGTLHGIVAARLDALPADEKSTLQDGAVMGKVFWSGAVQHDTEPGTLLLALARKGFLTRQRRSTVERETEWSFAHMLLRDVAYSQIPRAERSAKHRRAAEWIAAQGRPEDHAEMLAHHWVSALTLARAAGMDVSEIEVQTRFALRAAGDRSYSVNALNAAVDYYADAMQMWPVDDPEYPELRFRYARAALATGAPEARAVAHDVLERLLANGATERAAETETLLADVAWEEGQRDDADRHLARAQALIAGGAPSPVRARVLSLVSRYHALAGRSHEAIGAGYQAVEMAEALGLDEIRASALDNISIAKQDIGDPTGRDDLLRSIEILRPLNSPEFGRALNNLAFNYDMDGEVRHAAALLEEAIAFGDRVGSRNARFARGSLVSVLLELGRWDDAMAAADRFIEESVTDPHYQESASRSVRTMIRLARGDVSGADQDSSVALDLARAAKDPQIIIPTLVNRIIVELELGHEVEARAFLDEVTSTITAGGLTVWHSVGAWWMVDMAGLSAALVDQLTEERTPYGAAIQAVRAGDLELAAARFGATDLRSDEAYAWLRSAESHAGAGRPLEAGRDAERALAFYREVRASRFIDRAKVLIS
jgi:class 3 adenylate cyclase/tetratricopeptide (TPR) repeat protein